MFICLIYLEVIFSSVKFLDFTILKNRFALYNRKRLVYYVVTDKAFHSSFGASVD